MSDDQTKGDGMDESAREEGRPLAEKRYPIEASDMGIAASLVVVADDLERIDLEWTLAPEHAPAPASQEVVDAVVARVIPLGYPIKVVNQQFHAEEGTGRCLHNLYVGFERDPVQRGDGTGFEINITLGLDSDPEDPEEAPEVVAPKIAAWAARVEELVREALPKARVVVARVDRDADDIVVKTPPGIDPDDLEWRVDDLVDQASEEILEGEEEAEI